VDFWKDRTPDDILRNGAWGCAIGIGSVPVVALAGLGLALALALVLKNEDALGGLLSLLRCCCGLA